MARIRQHPSLHDAEALLAHWARQVESANHEFLLELARSPRLKLAARTLENFEKYCRNPCDGRETFRRDMLAQVRSILDNKDPAAIREAAEIVSTLRAGRSGRKDNWESPEIYADLSKCQKKLQEFVRKFLPIAPDPEHEARAAAYTLDLVQVYGRAYNAFSSAKRTRAAMDFEDLISGALDALRERQDLRDRTSATIKFLLIDEFQDTDGIQYELAKLLRRDGAQPGAELFIVGDAKQSIYNFRGAEVEVFMQAAQDSAERIALNRNFRSLPDTLNFINAFFEQTQLLTSSGAQYQRLEHHRDPLNETRVKFLIPAHADDKENAPERRRREADLIACCIAQMCGAENPVQVCDKDTGVMRPARFGDAAILFRATTDRHIYEEALLKHGVPYDVVAGQGFYERQEISDFINLLRVVADPYDDLALVGFLRSPIGALSDESLMRLTRVVSLGEAFRGNTSLADAQQQARLTGARALVAELRRRIESPLTPFLRHALSESGYEAILLSQYHGVQKASNLRKLIEHADTFSRLQTPRLRPFLRYLEDVASREIREGDAALHTGGDGAVTLMTIHKAKGLEFPYGLRCRRRARVQPPLQPLARVYSPEMGACRDVNRRAGGAPKACRRPDHQPSGSPRRRSGRRARPLCRVDPRARLACHQRRARKQ